jgi:hypothetical protein
MNKARLLAVVAVMALIAVTAAACQTALGRNDPAGRTETANIYTLVFDNAYIGYACGFNSQGDVVIYLPAMGEPGWHFIDLYPGPVISVPSIAINKSPAITTTTVP